MIETRMLPHRSSSSDFYEPQRAAISQSAGYLGFVIGFVGSAPIAWRYLRDGFLNGNVDAGVLHFLVVILGAGTLTGGVGLGVGRVIGAAWERQHRRRRSPSAEDAPQRPVALPDREVPEQPTTARRLAVRYDVTGIDAAAFLALAQRVWPWDYDLGRAEEALARTSNIGAWEGGRLIGAVRVLTDGYFFSTIPEILVDPDYRRCGIGRELMNRALDVAPRHIIVFGAQPGSQGFFEHLGCERGPVGYVMRTKATIGARGA
jgi:GNAT superfamily N-acetyltransferase